MPECKTWWSVKDTLNSRPTDCLNLRMAKLTANHKILVRHISLHLHFVFPSGHWDAGRPRRHFIHFLEPQHLPPALLQGRHSKSAFFWAELKTAIILNREIIKIGTTGGRHTKNYSSWLFVLNGLAKVYLSKCKLGNNLDMLIHLKKRETVLIKESKA